MTTQTNPVLGIADADYRTYELSPQQRLIAMFAGSQNSGPFGDEYHISAGWWLEGELELATLQDALNDLVAHHEIMRTTLRPRGVLDFVQAIHPAVNVPLIEVPVSNWEDVEVTTQEICNRVDTERFSATTVPALRAYLARYNRHRHLLILQCHHLNADALTLQLLIRELSWRYSSKVGTHNVQPRSLNAPQYAQHNETRLDQAKRKKNIHFWRRELDSAAFATIRTEFRKSQNIDKWSHWERFTFDEHLNRAISVVASSHKVSKFMVFLAAYAVTTSTLTGNRDLTLATFAPGRPNSSIRHAIGPYFDLLPLRVDISACDTFSDVVMQTRRVCINAYRHELPFMEIVRDVPHLIETLGQDDAQLFVIQAEQDSYRGQDAGVWDITPVRRRLSATRGGDIPDGGLMTLSLTDSEIIGTLAANSNRVSLNWTLRHIAQYKCSLRMGVSDPSFKLSDIEGSVRAIHRSEP